MNAAHEARAARLLVQLVLAASTTLACHSDDTAAPVDVSVRGSRAMDVTALNRELELARHAGDDALVGPVEVAARLARGRSAAWHSITAHPAASRDVYHVTIVLDGVASDDSVSGYRYTLLMSRPQPGAWSIVSAEQSWRCWPGRGHRDFSVEPCS